MTAELLDWQDEHLLDHRRRLRTGLFVSLAVHGVILALFAISPPIPEASVPEYIAVDLVAAPPAPAAGGRTAPSRPTPPPPPKTPPPAEAAPPEAQPVAPPPLAKSPVQVLPEESSKVREVKPEPAKTVAKVAPPPPPKPQPKPEPPRRPKEEELSYEAAMAELGLDEPSEALVPAKTSADVAAAAAESAATAAKAQAGAKMAAEDAAWVRDTTRHIQTRFPNFSHFQGRGLVARIQVDVTSSGALSGEPRLVGTSGNLDFDRMLISVIQLAAPLPKPPRPGPTTLLMRSE